MVDCVQYIWLKIKKYFSFLKKSVDEKPDNKSKSAEECVDEMFSSLILDDITLEVAENLYDLVSRDSIGKLREEIKNKTGFILPVVYVHSNSELEDNKYKIYIKEDLVFEDYTVPFSEYLEAETMYNLEKICKENIETIFTNKLFERYLDLVQKNNQKLLWEIGWYLAPTDIRTILIELIKAQKSIKDIEYVFEQIGKYAYLRSPKNILKMIKNSIKDFEWDISFQRPDVILPKID